MATDHSTETTAKLLKANHPETDTLWVLCVDLSVCMCVYGECCGVCYWKETGCFQATPEVVAHTCLNWCPLWLTITGGYACTAC